MKSFIKSVAAAAVIGVAMTSSAFAADPASCKAVRFADVGWTDIQVTTGATSVILEALGYEPQVSTLSVPVTYASLKNKDIDVFLGNWMPSMTADIKAYLDSLQPVVSPEKQAQIPAPWLLRRGVGLWKHFALNTAQWQPDPSKPDSWNRGSYIANTAGHCNECHTPRNAIMAADYSQQFAGGPHPGGEGKVPSIRGLIARGKYKDAADLVSAFQNGEMMGYSDMSSGGMGEVQSNMAKLSDSDVQALADYITSLK